MDMRPTPGSRAPDRGAAAGPRASAPASRDADAILARATEDEAAAREDEAAALEARERYRDGEMEPLEPDAQIAELLAPGEDLLAVRTPALLDRREPAPDGGRGTGCPGLAGDLYVTSARVVHVGRTVVEYDLDTISEAVVSAERLLLIVGDGEGISLDVDRPRLLRGEIGIARASRAARAGGCPKAAKADAPH